MEVITPSSDSDDDLSWSDDDDDDSSWNVYRCVRINYNVQLIPILNELEWWADYREARRDHWSIDSARFRHRIRETEELIGWIFSAEHINRKRN